MTTVIGSGRKPGACVRAWTTHALQGAIAPVTAGQSPASRRPVAGGGILLRRGICFGKTFCLQPSLATAYITLDSSALTESHSTPIRNLCNVVSAEARLSNRHSFVICQFQILAKTSLCLPGLAYQPAPRKPCYVIRLRCAVNQMTSSTEYNC